MSWSTFELRVRLAPLNQFKPSSKLFYWPFQGGTSFVDHSCYFCCVFDILLCASVYCCLVVTCWERADLCDVKLWVCYFPMGILGQVWYLIVSIPDLCPLSYLIHLWIDPLIPVCPIYLIASCARPSSSIGQVRSWPNLFLGQKYFNILMVGVHKNCRKNLKYS